jgi:hypothetical protein
MNEGEKDDERTKRKRGGRGSRTTKGRSTTNNRYRIRRKEMDSGVVVMM